MSEAMKWALAIAAWPLLILGMSSSGNDLARCKQNHSAHTCNHNLVR
jgi:hypothetical protein